MRDFTNIATLNL